MHYIYHILGIKIGVTTNVKHRMREQGFTEWEILESHTDGWLAGDREQELQREYGLPVDKVHYMISRQNRRLGGMIGGRISKPTLTFEQRSAISIATANTPKRLQQFKDAMDASRIKVTCPHCKKTGSKNVYHSKHFDNCRFNLNNLENVRLHQEILAYLKTHSRLNTSQVFNIDRKIIKDIEEFYEQHSNRSITT